MSSLDPKLVAKLDAAGNGGLREDTKSRIRECLKGPEGQELCESVEECQAKSQPKRDTGFLKTLFKK